MVKFHESTYSHPHPFETVTLAYFLRYPNPYSTHVVSTDVVSRHFDPDTQTLYSARLHLKRSKVPAAVLRLLPKSWLGISGSEGTSQSYVLERSIVCVRDGVMVTESVNLELTGILKVVETQLYRRPGVDLPAFVRDTYSKLGRLKDKVSMFTGVFGQSNEAAEEPGIVAKTFQLALPNLRSLWERAEPALDSSETDVATKVELISRLGEPSRRTLWTRSKPQTADGLEAPPPKMGFFRSWSTASLQRSIEAIGLRRTERAVPNSKKGMNIVLDRLRSGGLVAVLDGMRKDRERAFASMIPGEEE